MPEIHGITWDEIGRLGVDEHNNLYWDSKHLVTRRRVTLPFFVNAAAVIASLSTAAMAITQVWEFWLDRGWAPLW